MATGRALWLGLPVDLERNGAIDAALILGLLIAMHRDPELARAVARGDVPGNCRRGAAQETGITAPAHVPIRRAAARLAHDVSPTSAASSGWLLRKSAMSDGVIW